MKKINVVRYLSDIKNIYPQTYYDTKFSSIRIPILTAKALFNSSIDITVSDRAIRLNAGLEDITYYFEEDDDENDIIGKINEFYSFIQEVVDIIKEEVMDRI